MKGLSIQARILLIVLFPSLFLSLLLGTYLISVHIHDSEKELIHYGKTIANHIARTSRHIMLRNDQKTLQDITNLILEEKELLSITFFGPQHELLAYSGSDDLQSIEYFKNITLNNAQSSMTEKKENIVFTAPITINDSHLANINGSHPNFLSHKKTIGWIAINLSRTRIILEKYQVILVTFFIILLSLLFNIFIARHTAKYLTQRLSNLIQAVKKLEKGQLDTRITQASTGEIGELEEGFNQLAMTFQKSQQKLYKRIEQSDDDLKKSLSLIDAQNDKLVQAQQESLEAGRIKSEFIANMSHEIRTPMNSIIGFTNLLFETELTYLQRNYLTTIQKSTLNLLNLVNNILDLSRIDAGQLQLEHVAFDIRDSIEDVLTIMSPLANAKQLEFSALIDKDVPHKIISDPLRFKQIMINLVSNAIKFTDQGEVIVHVNLKKDTAKNVTLRVAVSDTGIGLSASDQRHVFSAFQQANTSIARKYGGTGLGLAICKKLIDQMGGKIGVTNNPGKGSLFWLTFTAEKTKAKIEQKSEIIDLAGLQVYLHEPHPITRAALKNILSEWQIETTEFSDFDALLNNTSPITPSIFIIGMNQQYKLENRAKNNLSALRARYNAPIIVLTNSCEQAVLEYFISIGADISLTKPITRNKLYHAIFQLTQESKSQPATKNELINLSGKRILCVDDNIANINLIHALLLPSHAQITLAYDGAEALQLAEQKSFDIILMDLRMPKMDGSEALKLIRKLPNSNATIPIIALSAHIAEHEYHNLTAIGFNDYLIKPVIKNNLFEKIYRWTIQPNFTDIKNMTTKQPTINNNPIIDWNLALKLANQNKALAQEMLQLLIKSLPEELNQIRQLNKTKEYDKLIKHVHKLHGAVCYCGVPRFKQAVAALEVALKQNNYSEIPLLFERFEFEANQVLLAESDVAIEPEHH